MTTAPKTPYSNIDPEQKERDLVKRRLIILAVALGVAWLICFGRSFFLKMDAFVQAIHKKNLPAKSHKPPPRPEITAESWPMSVDFTNWNVLPVKDSVIDHIDELNYFQRVIKLLEEGGNNRFNMAQVLDSKRSPEEYIVLYGVYEFKQQNVLDKLRGMEVPGRVKHFHDQIIEATSDQINFFRDFANGKSEDASLTLNQLLENQFLKRCNELLWGAYYEFQRLYPNRDKATNDAIESRLCFFDVI